MAPALAGHRNMEDVIHIAALLRDLTDAHERYPSLFDEQRVGMVLFDRAGSLIRANRAALDYLGTTLERIGGLRYQAFVHESERARGRDAFARVLRGETIEMQSRLVTADSETIDVPITLAPAIAERAIVGIYCTGRFVADAPTRKLQELTSLFVNTADAAIVFDAHGRCVEANASSENMTGFAASELRGRHYRSLLAPEARPAARDVFARVLLGESVSTDTIFVARDGRRVDVSGTLVPIVVDSVVVGAYTIARDVTVDRNLEAALREQTERMRELYVIAASTDESVETQISAAIKLGCRRLRCHAGYVTRSEGGDVAYLYGFGSTRHVTGSSEPLVGSLHAHVLSMGEAFASHAGVERGEPAFVGTPIDVDGERIGALCLVAGARRESASLEADRDFIGLLGMLVSSILEREERRRRAELLAFHDPLTGLANRTLLADRMAQAIASAERHQSVFAVHFYDLDHFKAINDERGHMRGDDVLRTVARRFESVARHEDTVARIGGDEFVILQPGVRSRADVESLARRLGNALSEPLLLGSTEYRITASAGIAMYPSDARAAETLLAHADAALYRVKQSGRDGIAFYSER